MTVTPGLDSIQQAHAAAEAGDAFWRDNLDLLLQAYPDRFVAVEKSSGRVIADDVDLDALIAKIERHGLQVSRTWVRFLAATPIHVAL